MVIQRTPNEWDEAGPIEERIADAVHEAEAHPDAGPRELEKLAQKAESGRDELRDRLYGSQHTE